MKIEFDKALLWLVPYLYVVSILYYLGYWGTFNIDAFNYYEVSDLVKGVVAAFGQTMLFVVLGCLVIFIGSWVTDDTVERKSLRERRKALVVLVTGLIFILLAIVFYVLFDVDKGAAKIDDSNHGLLLMKVLVFSMAGTFSFGLTVELSAGATLKSFVLTLCSTLLLTFLPSSAFIAGKSNALRIAQGKEYDYVVADSLAGPERAIYKYLGKTGSYYVLVGLENNKRVIVAADKLNPLVMERMSLNDSASTRKLKAYKQALKSVAKPR